MGQSGHCWVEMLDTETASGKRREPGRCFPSQCCPARRCPAGKHPAQALQQLRGRSFGPYTFLLPQTHLPAQVLQTARGLLSVSWPPWHFSSLRQPTDSGDFCLPLLSPICLSSNRKKNPNCLSSQLGAAELWELGAPLEPLRAWWEKRKTTLDVSLLAFPHPKAV